MHHIRRSTGRSTITALESYYIEIFKCCDLAECPAGIFCDLSKALTVALNWLLTYLNPRHLQAALRNSSNQNEIISSIRRELVYGVPQSSVLGPVIFLS